MAHVYHCLILACSPIQGTSGFIADVVLPAHKLLLVPDTLQAELLVTMMMYMIRVQWRPDHLLTERGRVSAATLLVPAGLRLALGCGHLLREKLGEHGQDALRGFFDIDDGRLEILDIQLASFLVKFEAGS